MDNSISCILIDTHTTSQDVCSDVSNGTRSITYTTYVQSTYSFPLMFSLPRLHVHTIEMRSLPTEAIYYSESVNGDTVQDKGSVWNTGMPTSQEYTINVNYNTTHTKCIVLITSMYIRNTPYPHLHIMPWIRNDAIGPVLVLITTHFTFNLRKCQILNVRMSVVYCCAIRRQ